jgi:hypothetical protein
MFTREPLFFSLLGSSGLLGLLRGLLINLWLTTVSSGRRGRFLCLCLGLFSRGRWQTLLFSQTSLTISLTTGILFLSLS